MNLVTNPARQRGVTMWSLIGVSTLVVLFALVTIKLIPGYLDNAKIQNALQAISENPGAANMSRKQIIDQIANTLYIDGGADAMVDLNTATVIKKQGNKKVLSIDYERVIPLAFNISALLDFENSVDIPLK